MEIVDCVDQEVGCCLHSDLLVSFFRSICGNVGNRKHIIGSISVKIYAELREVGSILCALA